MRVFRLAKSPTEYSCNVYYILGDWNTIPDMNTLIDTGPSGFIIPELESINSGVGKRKLNQVIITHDHFDHSAGLKEIVPRYKPKIYAHNAGVMDSINIYDGMELMIGDTYGQLLFTPGHSNDSISVYVPRHGALFSGDTMLAIYSEGGSYTSDFYNTILKLSALDVKIIYPGHGDPITENIKLMFDTTLKIVRNSKILD